MLIKELPIESSGCFVQHPEIQPFSVFNTRSKEWQHRKKIWLSYGIQSELGRDTNGAVGGLFEMMNKYDKGGKRNESPNSIFDPVLCELLYSWLTRKGDTIIDPFAGGSVRGIVAAMLKRKYFGIDLNKDQILANQKQADAIQQIEKDGILWYHGDSLKVAKQFPEADFIFSCPPYYNLEVYSDHPDDISNMDVERFRVRYETIIGNCCEKLKRNRFACFVVGNVRDKQGKILDLVGDTISAFEEAGLNYYNEMILVNNVGSLPIRINKQFSVSRKFGKTHQNILVFVKGNPKIAANYLEGRSGKKRRVKRTKSSKARNSIKS